MKPRIIVFLGTVGSGKTTQMSLLSSYMRGQGLKVRTSFLKTGHLLAYILEVFLAKTLAGKRKDVYPIRAIMEEKPGIFRRLFKLWVVLDVISIYIRFFFTIYIPIKLNYFVLVEEYIPAIIADYIYLSKFLNQPLKTISFALNLVSRLYYLGGPAKGVYLDTDTDELRLRWRRRGTPEEKLDYLHMQRTVLLSVTRTLLHDDLVYINTSNRNIMETNKSIISSLKNDIIE